MGTLSKREGYYFFLLNVAVPSELIEMAILPASMAEAVQGATL